MFISSLQLYLMFSELHFDFIRLIGDLQLRVQSFLSLLQPVC